MRRTTKKLSGPSLERFLRRFFKGQPGLDAAQAERLAARAKRTFSMVRVRTVASGSAATAEKDGPTAAIPSEQPSVSDKVARVASALSQSRHACPPHETPDAPAQETKPFDPYAFGLVPTFQRQGADGLLRMLATVEDVSDLRKLARAQQIVLPLELRSGEAEADDVRRGILAAVEKRIADRRAAAG